MNAEHLIDILDFALKMDSVFELPAAIDSFVESFEALTVNPIDPELQKTFKGSLDGLKGLINGVDESLSSVRKSQLSEVNALSWFSDSLAEKIVRAIAENNVTPTVGLAEIKAIAANRMKFMASMSSTRNGLKTLGIWGYHLTPGVPELSVTIPRELFDNNLSGLVKELRQVSFISRTIAATAEEETAEFDLKSISTTEPVFWIQTSVAVATAFAATVTWALDTLQRVENLKQARAKVSNTGAFSEKEIEKIFGSKILQEIENAKKELRLEMLGAPNSGRHREIGNQFDLALSAMLSRFERGMKVEIHFTPKQIEIKKPADGESEEVVELETPIEQQELAAAAERISYLEVDSTPVLQITHLEEESDNGLPNAAPDTDED